MEESFFSGQFLRFPSISLKIKVSHCEPIQLELIPPSFESFLPTVDSSVALLYRWPLSFDFPICFSSLTPSMIPPELCTFFFLLSPVNRNHFPEYVSFYLLLFVLIVFHGFACLAITVSFEKEYGGNSVTRFYNKKEANSLTADGMDYVPLFTFEYVSLVITIIFINYCFFFSECFGPSCSPSGTSLVWQCWHSRRTQHGSACYHWTHGVPCHFGRSLQGKFFTVHSFQWGQHVISVPKVYFRSFELERVDVLKTLSPRGRLFSTISLLWALNIGIVWEINLEIWKRGIIWREKKEASVKGIKYYCKGTKGTSSAGFLQLGPPFSPSFHAEEIKYLKVEFPYFIWETN